MTIGSRLERKSRRAREGTLAPFEFAEAKAAASYLRGKSSVKPQVGIVLGSGLGDTVRGFHGDERIPYTSIPHFPRPTVQGHRGVLSLGYRGKSPVALLSGRVHLYEGYSASQVILPIRVLGMLGIKNLILTCAAGGIARWATPGSFMVFSDHLNLQGHNPLVGVHEARWGERFVAMTHAYDVQLRQAAMRGARALGLRCFEGVYAAVLGPSFETPAEVRALRSLGADAVGMSTVPEVIAARQMGIRVLAIALITNRAAGQGRLSISHNEVLDAGKREAENLESLVGLLVSQIT